MKVQVGEEINENPASGTGKPAKISKEAKKVLVDSKMTATDVLKFDAEGAELLFDPKDGFLRLEDAIVEQLGRQNKAEYSRARVFNETYRGQEDAAFTERFKVDKEFSGTAIDKLEDITVRDGLRHTWVNPAGINQFQRKGWRVAGKDDARTFLGSTADHHEIVRDGKTELVLMVIPESLGKANDRKMDEENARVKNSYDEQGLAAIESSGAKGFIDKSSKNDRDYEDLSAEEL